MVKNPNTPKRLLSESPPPSCQRDLEIRSLLVSKCGPDPLWTKVTMSNSLDPVNIAQRKGWDRGIIVNRATEGIKVF